MAAASVVPRTAWWKGHLRSGRREAMVVAGWQGSGVLWGWGSVPAGVRVGVLAGLGGLATYDIPSLPQFAP